MDRTPTPTISEHGQFHKILHDHNNCQKRKEKALAEKKVISTENDLKFVKQPV